MEIAQRGTGAVTTNAYGPCDRWTHYASGDTFSTTQVAFASGDALYNPTSGNTAAQFFTQVVVTSVAGAASEALFYQPIENVRLMAGKTVTVSFWAKAASGTPLIGVEFGQNFGTGGSPSSALSGTGQAVTLSTSWAKYTQQHTLGSLSGKTIGSTANTSFTALYFWLDAGSNFNTRSGSIGQATKTVSIAQVQVELGSTVTSFEQEATGVTLARCQRYYYRNFPAVVSKVLSAYGVNWSTTNSQLMGYFPVPMRITPTAMQTSGTANHFSVEETGGGGVVACTAVPTYHSGTTNVLFALGTTVAAGLTSLRSVWLETNATNGASAYLGWSAEL